MKKSSCYGGWFLLCALATSKISRGQLIINAQIRPRTEFRNGYGAPLAEGSSAAVFTSQRTRLSLSYGMYRLKLGLSLQDVRVWGQDASTINATTTQNNNGLMLHEAWAEIFLTDTTLKNKSLSFKIGRQELTYDDQRLLGNLDWLQQGRRHDAALLKFETPFYTLHAGAAYNQNQQNAAGTIYNPVPPGNYAAGTNGATMYKSFEFFYAGRRLPKGSVSFLFFSDQFSRYHTDTPTTVKRYQTGVWTRATTGFYLHNTFFNALDVSAASYYQFGQTPDGHSLSAGLLSASVQYQFNTSFSAGPGLDYTTGGNSGNTSHSFDPLYGTPHKFWGLMDYFYAASSFGQGGLADYYFKTKWKAADDFWVTADIHQFCSAASVYNPSDPASTKKSFGQELDLVSSYRITKQIALEAGYGHFFNTALLTSVNVKNVPNAKTGADWTYVMINITPSLLFK